VDGKWERSKPSIDDYNTIFECHDRGALLVSVVFDAFLAIYRIRTADLVRLAHGYEHPGDPRQPDNTHRH